MQVFSFAPNARETITLRPGYLTDIIEAHDTTEARLRLRRVPTFELEYSLLTRDARRTGLLKSLISAEQPNEMIMPLWNWVNPLTANIVPGATSIPVDTTDIPWLGNWVNWMTHLVLWRDPFTCEALVVSDASALDHVVVASGATLAWTAGLTRVHPAVIGTLDGYVTPSRETPAAAQANVKFRMRGEYV